MSPDILVKSLFWRLAAIKIVNAIVYCLFVKHFLSRKLVEGSSTAVSTVNQQIFQVPSNCDE